MTQRGRSTAAGAAGLAAALAMAAPLVARWEGLRLDPYRDIAGIETVCYGETAGPMRRHTPEECRTKLLMSLRKHGSPVLSCLPDEAPLSVKAAFVSFGYNVGVAAACRSTAARFASWGDYRGACTSLVAWNKARIAGRLVPVDGLTKRRAAERDLCLQGVA